MNYDKGYLNQVLKTAINALNDAKDHLALDRTATARSYIENAVPEVIKALRIADGLVRKQLKKTKGDK